MRVRARCGRRALIERRLLAAFDWFVYTRTDSFLWCPLVLPAAARLRSAVAEARALAIVRIGAAYSSTDCKLIAC